LKRIRQTEFIPFDVRKDEVRIATHHGGFPMNAPLTRTAPRAEELCSRLALRTARVGIVGLGYVGLPLAETFAWAGYPVLGFDSDPHRVARLRRGESYIGHISDDRVADMVATGRFDATCDPRQFAEMDAIIICVPTPLTDAREPDLSYIVSTGESIQPH